MSETNRGVVASLTSKAMRRIEAPKFGANQIGDGRIPLPTNDGAPQVVNGSPGDNTGDTTGPPKTV